MEEYKPMKSEDQKPFKEVHVVKIPINFIFGFYLPLGTILHLFSLSCGFGQSNWLTQFSLSKGMVAVDMAASNSCVEGRDSPS